MRFDLLSNPFAVLGLTGDAPVAVIAARARDLGTAAAEAAGRTLLVPRTRLQAELAYLPGAERGVADTCIQVLGLGGVPDLWPLTPPARANVLAFLASKGTAAASQLRDLAGLQDAVQATAGEIVGQARERALMPPVPTEMLDAALAVLASQHAEAFAVGMLALPDGADLFAQQLLGAAPDATARTRLLRHAADAWDRATSSEAARDLEFAAPIEATLASRPDPAAARQLATVVLRFATRTKPPREACRLVGLPHRPSVDAAQRWRTAALDLNNRQDAVPEAVTVFEALATAFGTTDELGARTAADLEVCRSRLARGEGTAEMRRLLAAIQAAVAQELAFQRCGLLDGAPTNSTPPVVVELQQAFITAARAARSDLPWQQLRNFAMRLHNEFSAAEAALSFIRLAVQHARGNAVAAEMLRQLERDLRNLRRQQLEIDLAAAIRGKQRRITRRVLTELLEVTDDAAGGQNVRSALERLRKQEAARRITYGVFAFLALIALSSLLRSPDTAPVAPRRADVPSMASALTPAPPPANLRPVAPVIEDGRPERRPAPGTPVLARAELRWCRYQDARVRAAIDYQDAIRLRPTLDVDRYNASVRALNSFIAPVKEVCEHYNYWPADGVVIDAELRQYAGSLKADGEGLVAAAYRTAVPADDWVPAPGPPAPGQSPKGTTWSPQAPSLAFMQGQADRRDLEAWFNGLEGAFHDGAQWWSSVRSAPNPPSCDKAPGPDHATAVAGCLAGRARLTTPDRRRHAEPDYRAGWNNP